MPAPRKREAELQRPRGRKGTSTTAEVTRGELREVTIPNIPKSWHAIARRLFESFKTSGQADFFQNTDWALAYFICEQVSDYQNATRKSAQMLDTIVKATERLMMTEADRRKVRIELHAPPPPPERPAELVQIDAYRARLEAGQNPA